MADTQTEQLPAQQVEAASKAFEQEFERFARFSSDLNLLTSLSLDEALARVTGEQFVVLVGPVDDGERPGQLGVHRDVQGSRRPHASGGSRRAASRRRRRPSTYSAPLRSAITSP